MNAAEMKKALGLLDSKLSEPLKLVIGGGAAMLMVYGHGDGTSDMDAAPQPFVPLDELEPLIHEVANELGLPKDWLNTHFTDFTYVVPDDFNKRLRPVFQGNKLIVNSFGPEDIMVMKLTAGRPKDRPHLRRLLRLPNVDLEIVENHLMELKKSGLSTAATALDLLDELRDEMES